MIKDRTPLYLCLMESVIEELIPPEEFVALFLSVRRGDKNLFSAERDCESNYSVEKMEIISEIFSACDRYEVDCAEDSAFKISKKTFMKIIHEQYVFLQSPD